MKCTECLLQVSGNKAHGLRHCINCGRRLIPTVKDILEYNSFDIVSEVRTEQLRMAADIEKVLASDKGTLMAEGGTGLGKSYAYAIPGVISILERQELAKDSDKVINPFRMVIATAKKSLQHQLAADLPGVCSSLGVSANIVVYKGRNNYACWKMLKAVPPHEQSKFVKLIDLAKVNGTPADLADWEGVKPVWWDDISVEHCALGINCEHFRHCRPAVKHADIIITNHHILGLDLSLFNPGWLLGDYSFLVVDEAHHFSKALRDLLSKSLTLDSIVRASRRIRQDNYLQSTMEDMNIDALDVCEKIDSLAYNLQQLIFKAAKSADSAKRYTVSSFKGDFETLKTLTEDCLLALIPFHDELVKDLNVTKSLELQDKDQDEGYYMAMLNRLGKILRPLNNAKAFIETHEDSDKVSLYVTSVTAKSDDMSLDITPLDVGPVMEPILNGIKHKAFVSATLSLNGDFSYFKNDVGLTDDSKGVVYKSPFDYRNNVALYLPPWDMPLPAYENDAERASWLSHVSDSIRNLCSITKGGVFVLFSAEKDMNDVELYAHQALRDDGLILLVQRGQITQYVESFRQTPNGVLFGLKSLWEGIDIVGDSLRCVIIPKLPFPHPNDPVVASKSERITALGRSSFHEVSLPAMFTDMRQGTGRLIRSKTDKGIIAILDVRVWTGGGKGHLRKLERIKADALHRRLGYGKDLLDILDFTNITNDFTRLERWYRKMFSAPKQPLTR